MLLTLVVLGDVGRSPRMQYHALAVVDTFPNAEVELIGYRQSLARQRLESHPRIKLRALVSPSLPAALRLPAWLQLAWSGFRFAVIGVQLLWCLLVGTRRPLAILVQTPPAFPSLWMCATAARLRRAKLIVDWHNFSFALLAAKFGESHWAVKVSNRLERWGARRAHHNLCVSRAMAHALCDRWRVERSVVFRDRPNSVFAPLRHGRKREVLQTLSTAYSLGDVTRDGSALIVSSTSWTDDEPIDWLLRALDIVESKLAAGEPARPQTLPHLCFLVTGKGRNRAPFEAELARRNYRFCTVRTLWLSADDYPCLLACSDLGLSFHRSASGFDLAMKVEDMRGAGLPVAALDYGHCLGEQIVDGLSGRLFASPRALAQSLFELFDQHPSAASGLSGLANTLAQQRDCTWEQQWRESVAPLVQSLAG